MKKTLSALCLSSILVTSCGPQRIDRKDCGFYMENHRRIGWGKNSIPVVFYIDESVPREFIPKIIEAGEEWEKVLNKNMFIFTTDKPVVTFVQNLLGLRLNVISTSTDIGNTVNAVTKFTWVFPYLVNTDIVINMTEQYWDIEDPINPGMIELKGVMMHEFGHALGLRHNPDDNTSIMYPYSKTGEKILMNETDMNNIICHYGEQNDK